MIRRKDAGTPSDSAQGLRIGTAIGVVVAGCGIGGLLLATMLAIAWTWVDHRSTELSRDTSAVHDLRRLDDELAEWATKVDLVLGSGQTWFMDDLDRAAARMRTLLEGMKWDAMLTIRGDFDWYLDRELARLDETAANFGDDRQLRLAQAVEASDAELEPLLARFHVANAEIQGILSVQRVELNQARRILNIVSWVATGLYLAFIALLWRWASATITRPLETLARATRDSLKTGGPLAVESSGPREVRMLTQSVLSLTGSLEAIVQERTVAIEAMAELRRVILNTVPFPLAHIDVNGILLTCNNSYEAFFGVATSTDVIGRSVAELPLGPLLEMDGDEHDVTDGAGHRRTVHLITADVSGEMGQVLCLIDVTERVEHATRLRVMLRELDHRVRNTLAAVQTLVDMERKRIQPIGADLGELSGRIQSMSQAHDLLAVSQWSGVALRRAVAIILRPWTSKHALTVEGVDVRLAAERAMPVCMLLNELATNAVKHGALSSPEGQIALEWVVDDGDVSLTWTESGGPLLDGQPPQQGTGLGLIHGFIEHQLGGSLEMEWLHKGLRVTMRFAA